MVRMSQKPDQMMETRHILTRMFRESTVKLKQRNKTLIWQNSNMKRLKLDEAELNFVLYLKQNYQIPPSEQFLEETIVDLEINERKLTSEAPKPEDFALFDSAIHKRKDRIILEQRQLNNLEETEKVLKKQIYLMENSLEVKTLEFGRVRTELAKIRKEFSSVGTRLNIFEKLYYSLEDKHDNLFSKLQTMSKNCSEISVKKTDTDNKVIGLKELITLNEFQFNFELNEVDRQCMHHWNFENFLSDISRERDWYSLDNCLKKLEKELNTRYRYLNEDQAAKATIKEVANNYEIDLILQEFRLNQANNFALFKFMVEIRFELKYEDNELHCLLDKFSQEDKLFLRQNSQLRNTLLSYQEKVNAEMESAETALQVANDAVEQMTKFHKELVELMNVLACDSKLKIDVENANITEDFPKDAIIDIQERINNIIRIKQNLKGKVNMKAEYLQPYETHHQNQSPPVILYLD